MGEKQGEKQEILQQLAQAVVDMDEEEAATMAGQAIRAGIDHYEAITDRSHHGHGHSQ